MAPHKAVILVGGPSRGTRFRPLSLEIPKPLFPIAGMEMVWHAIAACAKVPTMEEILLLGFYEPARFTTFIEHAQRDFKLPIRYLREYQSLGTGGGLHYFRQQILRGKPSDFFLLHSDICCAFPLVELLACHQHHPQSLCTVLAKRVTDFTSNFGCMVKDEQTDEVLHYVEKPETFISDLINCGAYVFSPRIFDEIELIVNTRSEQSEENPDLLTLERDVFSRLAGTKRLFVFETTDFWRQIKTAGSAVAANTLYLEYYRREHPERLAPISSDKEIPASEDISLSPVNHQQTDVSDRRGPIIIGNVYLHPDARIHATAMIGPNVSIGPKVVIEEGVRVRDSIILDRVIVKRHACVLHSVVGWDSKIGEWARVEGFKNADMPHPTLTMNGIKNPGITIFGEGVHVADEIIIRNCVVLPNKILKANYHNEILL